MTAAQPDTGIAHYLRSAVSLAQERVFRPDLPDEEIGLMPRACIVVRPAGGYTTYGAGFTLVGDPRVDILCHGITEFEAELIAQEAAVALRAMQRQIQHGVLLYSAVLETGPIPAPDPVTEWPRYMLSARILIAEETVT